MMQKTDVGATTWIELFYWSPVERREQIILIARVKQFLFHFDSKLIVKFKFTTKYTRQRANKIYSH